jgi:hypothetical protein
MHQDAILNYIDDKLIEIDTESFKKSDFDINISNEHKAILRNLDNISIASSTARKEKNKKSEININNYILPIVVVSILIILSAIILKNKNTDSTKKKFN